jgi:hypothetical protein
MDAFLPRATSLTSLALTPSAAAHSAPLGYTASTTSGWAGSNRSMCLQPAGRPDRSRRRVRFPPLVPFGLLLLLL